MSEKSLSLGKISPVEIFGANDKNLEVLANAFPKLKLVARGNKIKVIGEDDDIGMFTNLFERIIQHYLKYNNLSESDLKNLVMGEVEPSHGYEASDIIVYGPNGLVVKARTPGQRAMMENVEGNDMVFAIGPAGTGKTYTAVALAVRALKDKEVRRIILTRPAVEAGENLGFLPGDLKEKLDPYLQPLYDALGDMIPAPKLKSYLETGVIQIAPLAFMRGRTLDNAFVILDEAQNATESQLKMFLTRMGRSAKFVITGDLTQIDLPKKMPSGLIHATTVLKDVQGINFVYLDEKDVVRHKLVSKIIAAYNKENRKE